MRCISTASAVTALPLACEAAVAQQQLVAQARQQENGTARIGTLRCDVAGNRSLVFGSPRDLDCRFTNVNGRRGNCRGWISCYGVNLSFANDGGML